LRRDALNEKRGQKTRLQDIDAHGEFKNCVITLLVMSNFLSLPGASRTWRIKNLGELP